MLFHEYGFLLDGIARDITIDPRIMVLLCSEGYVYWTDYLLGAIFRANLSTGQDMEMIVDSHIPEPGETICRVMHACNVLLL